MLSPITLEDFEDCGKVYEKVKQNPDIDITQVAKLTRLSPARVKDITKYLQQEKLIPKKWFEEKSEGMDPGKERIIEIFAPPQTNLPSMPKEIAVKHADQIEAQNNEQKDNVFICFSCQNRLPKSYYDDHDGLCPSCYYKALLIDATKQERRSGIYGSDRAGTW